MSAAAEASPVIHESHMQHVIARKEHRTQDVRVTADTSGGQPTRTLPKQAPMPATALNHHLRRSKR